MLTGQQLQDIRTLIDENGFLPLTNKALRLLDCASRNPACDAKMLSELRSQFESSGYLPRSKAMKLLELANVA